tara:strand:- start:906 stop:1817 length:912 start_codon:yes stop_codon:yes gene_type:complete
VLFIIKKIIGRYKQLKRHPLVDNAILGIIKYLSINIILRFKKNMTIWNWVNGLKYYLMIGDSCMISNCYFVLDDYEELLFILNYLKGSDTFIDVGANHGNYTLIASGIVGSKTISIEPVETTFKRLKMNIELNKLNNVVLKQVGISNNNGNLRISNDRGELNRILKDNDHSNNEAISVTTLDDLLIEEKNISMIKIDVEGYEKQVLEGAFNILKCKNLNVLQIELNNSNQYYGYRENEIIRFLKKFGFKPYRYNPLTKGVLELPERNHNSINTLFIKNLKKVRERLSEKTISINKKTIKFKSN